MLYRLFLNASFALVICGVFNAARFTPRGNARTAPVEISFNRFSNTALSARLKPYSLRILEASSVNPLVNEGVDKFKVFNSIVYFVAVDVVNLIAFRDNAIIPFPYNDVFKALSSSVNVITPDISLSGKTSPFSTVS